MARRYSTMTKPFEVVSVVQGRSKTSKTYSESFDDEGKARAKAEKVAKEKNVRSVYLRHLDAEGDIIKTDTIKKYTPPESE